MASRSCQMVSGKYLIMSGRCQMVSGSCWMVSERCQMIEGPRDLKKYNSSERLLKRVAVHLSFGF